MKEVPLSEVSIELNQVSTRCLLPPHDGRRHIFSIRDELREMTV